MDEGSGVGVLDKVAMALTALGTSPLTFAGLVSATGLTRSTVHRLAVALERHCLVAWDFQGHSVLGPWPAELASSAAGDPLLATAGLILTWLYDITDESAQLFCRQGDFRICSATVERPSGLRDTAPLGARLSATTGPVVQVPLAWEEPESLSRLLEEATFTMLSLQQIRRCGWAQSVTECEPGVTSVSAPVLFPSEEVIVAVSVSGLIERLTRQLRRPHVPAVMITAERPGEVLHYNDTEWPVKDRLLRDHGPTPHHQDRHGDCDGRQICRRAGQRRHFVHALPVAYRYGNGSQEYGPDDDGL